MDDEACLALADSADAAGARASRSEPVGALHGIPWAFKDLEPAIGFPWTRGSPIFRNDRPAADSVLVERLRQAGVLPIGKTNTPEFGMGSQTYNDVYGTTVNPYDLTKTAGGSSGGAAASVAAGMLPGPIARSVSDAAYLLGAMAGSDPRDPACAPSDPSVFAGSLERSFKGVRIAWCADLGGLPLDHRVRDVLESQRHAFEGLGCIVEEAHPNLASADEVFLTMRAFRSWTLFAPLLAKHRAELKPEAIQEIEHGARLTASQVSAAMVQHGQIMEEMHRFHDNYPFMLAAVNQVPPFDASLHWPAQINGTAMDHYIAWMKSAYWITTTFQPAISVPAGFTAEGLPVGIQITGRYRDDLGVLQLASAFEQMTGVGKRRPHSPADQSAA